MASSSSSSPKPPDTVTATDEELTLIVKWSGKEYELRICADDSVAELKRRICLLTNVLPKRQKLLHPEVGNELSDDSLLLSQIPLKPSLEMTMISTTEDDIVEDEVVDIKDKELNKEKTVETGVTGCGELNNQATLLPETVDDEKDISDQTLSAHEVGGHESTIQTETHTQMILVETSESVSTEVNVSIKGDNSEASAHTSNLKQITELAETVRSETVGLRESDSKLMELKSQSDTIPTDSSGTMIDGEECKAFSSQDEVPAVSLTTSIDLHMVNTSSDANEQVNIFETQKVSSGEPENSQTVQPVNASSFGNHIDQQVRNHTEDTHQGTQSVEGCPVSEESKDAGDADAAGQVLLQQSEETNVEENPVTEVVSVPETHSILDNDVINEKPNTSSLANLGSEAGEGGEKEDKTAVSSGMKTAGTPVSHPTGESSGQLYPGDIWGSMDFFLSTTEDDIIVDQVTSDDVVDDFEDKVVDIRDMELNKQKTVQVGVTGCGELNNQATLLPETVNDEKDISGQTLSAHDVGGLDVPGTLFQDALVSNAHTPAREHESTIQTETHTQLVLVETSESVDVSQMDESTEVDASIKGDSNEASARMSNLKQNTELAETVGSETAGLRESASNLMEPKSQSDTIPTDSSETMIDGKECKAFSSQDEVPAVSLTTSIDLHMVNTSSDANEEVNIFETQKVSSDKPESSQTVQPVNASSFGNHIDQQVRNHTEDTHQGTQSVEGCPVSEKSKDAGDADAAGQVLLQQSEEINVEENSVTEVVSVPETHSILDNDVINEKPYTSSLANLGSEAGEGGDKEDNTAVSSGMKTAGTPVSHPTGDVIKIGESCASTSSEAFAKSYVTEEEKVATNLGTPVISFPAVETSELQLNKTKTDSSKKAEDQNNMSFMSAESPVLNRNETFSSELNLPSGPRKAGNNSQVVNFSQATLVSPIAVGSPSTSILEKTAAKSSKTKPERKPRATPKSAGKETSRKRNSIKGATPVQHLQSGGKTDAVNQSSAFSIQITPSTEKQQSLQTPPFNSFGTTLSTPAASLRDLNSSALSSIFRRPFTDLQQVQLRAQIFVYGALIQGSAPDEAYMISAFGGPDGEKGSWEKAWRACSVRAQKMHVSTPGTPLQSRQGKTGTPSVGHTTSKESSAIKPMIPLSSPLWSVSTSLDTLQSSSIQRGSAAAHQSLLSSSHAHQTAPITNIVGHNTPWMSPLPYRNPWLASPETSGFDGGSRFPVFPIIESAKLTATKESPLSYSGGKHVLSGTSSNVHKRAQTLEPASPIAAPAQHSTGTKTRKRKKMPDSGESGPSILNSLKQTEVFVSPFVSMSTSVPIAAAPGSLASNAGTLPSVASITSAPMNLVSTFSGKKMKSSLASPIFGGNLVPEVKQRSVLSVDTVDKLNEAKMHAEEASALATAAVRHSEHIWKQIDQQRHADHQSETQGKLAWASVAIAAAAAVAKAAAAAANVAANASLQAKLMAEEASLPSVSYQGNELPKSHAVTTQGQGTPDSILKGEGGVVSSSLVLSTARETAKKRIEAATAATKRAENMDSIVKAAELASEAVSQAGILVSMGHPPSLEKLVETGPSNYWRQAQESEEAQPCKVGVAENETMVTIDGTFASPRTVPTELDGSVRTADGLSGLVSATGKKMNRKKDHNGAELPKKNDVVFEPEFGSKSGTQIESEQILKTTNDEGIKEGFHVEVFKEGPEVRTAWYSANVLSIEDGKAYVLFSDLSIEQGTDKLKEWVALKGDGDEAPKIRTARSVMPYEGTRKRRRAAIGDPVWKIGDRVDSWVHDCWLEGVITEKNKKDENTLTVHFPAQGDTLTIKSWNLRPSLVWKDGRWVECSNSGENISSSHEGDTPKEKRPRLGPSALVDEVEDTKMKLVDDADLAKRPQTGVLDLGVSDNTFNIGRSTKEENKPGPVRMKRTGLQTQGAKVIFGVPKPGKKRKFMDVSKHYVSEASTTTREGKEPARPVRPIVPQNPGPGSWRLPSKTVSREKQTTMIPKPKTFRPAPKAKEKPVAAARIIPRKDSRNTTTGSNVESDDAVDKSGESKGTVSETNISVPSKGTGKEQTTSSSQSQDTSSLGIVEKGRLAKIEEDKADSSKASHGMEPRRSVRRIQPTSRVTTRRSAIIDDGLEDSFDDTQQKSPKQKVTVEASRWWKEQNLSAHKRREKKKKEVSAAVRF